MFSRIDPHPQTSAQTKKPPPSMFRSLLAVSPQSRYPTMGSIICFCGLLACIFLGSYARLTGAHVAEARLAAFVGQACKDPGSP